MLARKTAILFSSREDEYGEKILSMRGASGGQILPLWETSGLVAEDLSPNNADGQYVGATLAQTTGAGPTMGLMPFLDGVNDLVNIYSANLNSIRNFAEFTVGIWIRVNAAFWNDVNVKVFFTIRTTATADVIQIYKDGAINTIKYDHISNTNLKQVIHVVGAPTSWLHLGITASVSNNRMKAYLNGSQVGATQTGLIAPSNNALVSTRCNIGVLESSLYMQGYPSWFTYFPGVEYSAAEMLQLATPQ